LSRERSETEYEWSAMTTEHRYVIVDFDEVPPVDCPCGEARRALLEAEQFPGTIHRTVIRGTARTHYHERLTETYYILECQPDARLELDGESIPVRQGVCVVIPPGIRHRAVGDMTVLIVVLPKFDPSDEIIEEA
jgi:mannose-6-phosphate isomerase-like protein (cupin superfamily)